LLVLPTVALRCGRFGKPAPEILLLFAFAVARLLVFMILVKAGILVAARSGERSSLASAMNTTPLNTLVALVPVCMLFFGSVLLFIRGETLGPFLRLLGAGCLLIVVLTHFREALHLFRWVHRGDEFSVGHYLDLASAVLGLTYFG
jgi:hypothetical protein